MRFASATNLGSVAVLVLVAAVLGLTAAVQADDVVIEEGIVSVRNGDVMVVLRNQGEVVPTTNGHGLLRAGQIEDGDVVAVLLFADEDKRHKHRGHVTILK